MAQVREYAATDEELKTWVVNELSWDSRIDASRVAVLVDDGLVTLKGTVPSYAARDAAEDDALGVLGVVAVDNQLGVKLPGALPVPSDSTIRDNILSTLEVNPEIDELNIQVVVADREATLTGTVPTHWEKRQAAVLAGLVQGVVAVKNDLAVVPTAAIGDEIIAEDVTNALMRSALVDAEMVDVTVSNGTVTLQGNVPTTAARIAAYRAASRTAGVVNVRNQLMVRR
ncbi:MAG: BON domain-containing protein [Oleiphilaceae bacterium]|nr:BON domain-containing protein [Oleiphilaceae bacterium]